MINPGTSCLSLHQPWASLIAIGAKRIETRSWPCPEALIGERIGIHAALSDKGLPPRKHGDNQMALGDWIVSRQVRRSGSGRILRDYHEIVSFTDTSRRAPLPLGAIVATARLVDCLPMVEAPIGEAHILVSDDALWLAEPAEQEHHEPWAAETLQEAVRIDEERPYGDYAPGRWGYVLADIEPFDDPVPAKGRQRVWKYTPPPCSLCGGVGHLGPATGSPQSDYGRACPSCQHPERNP